MRAFPGNPACQHSVWLFGEGWIGSNPRELGDEVTQREMDQEHPSSRKIPELLTILPVAPCFIPNQCFPICPKTQIFICTQNLAMHVY
jgi:hypothetical protein